MEILPTLQGQHIPPVKALNSSLRRESREGVHLLDHNKNFLSLLRKSMSFKSLKYTPVHPLTVSRAASVTRISRPGTASRSRDWEFKTQQ